MMTRREELKFDFTVDKSGADRHSQSIGVLLDGNNIIPGRDDTLHITYKVNIEYWGDVCTKLKAVSRVLSDPDTVVKLSTRELLHGKCLIQDLLNQVSEVQRIINTRTP